MPTHEAKRRAQKSTAAMMQQANASRPGLLFLVSVPFGAIRIAALTHPSEANRVPCKCGPLRSNGGFPTTKPYYAQGRFKLPNVWHPEC